MRIVVAVLLLGVTCGCSNKRSRLEPLISERLQGIRNGTLMIASERLLDRELAEILADPRVGKLKALSLHNNALTAESMRVITASPKLAQLQVLDLSFNPIGDDGVAQLAASEILRPLRILALANVGASGRMARSIASSPHAAEIAELDLRFQAIGTDAALLVGKRKTLRLGKTAIDASTAATLLRTAQAQTIDLSENPIGSMVDIGAISSAIIDLDLRHCALD